MSGLEWGRSATGISSLPLSTPVPSLRALLTSQISPQRRLEALTSSRFDSVALSPYAVQERILDTLRSETIDQSWVLREPAVLAMAASGVSPEIPQTVTFPPPPPLIAMHSALPEVTYRRSRRIAGRSAELHSAAPSGVLSSPDNCCSGGDTSKKRKTAETPSSSSKKKTRVSPKKPPPHVVKELDREDDRKPAPQDKPSCAICISEPEKDELSMISGCDHRFCFSCISKWADRENTCPLCKKRFAKIMRVNPQKRKKGGPSISNNKRVKQRDQRSDLVSHAGLEGLLATLASSGHPLSSRLGYLWQPRHTTPRHAHFPFGRDDSLDDDEEADLFPDNFMDALIRSTIQQQLTAQMQSQRQRTVTFGATLAHGFVSNAYDQSQSVSMAAHAAAHAAHVASMSHAVAAAAARSYATNSSDQYAGRAASNPLEIADDEDDDDVEVIQVTRSA